MTPRWRAVLLAAALVSPAYAADFDAAVRRIKAVGPEGAGAADAAAAWRELARLPAADLPRLLAALDDASPAAANWLRSAIDAVAERERAAGHPLPTAALEAFVRDTRHAGRGRRLAFELLCSTDPTARDRLLPTMLDDPGAELRYDAVDAALATAKALPKDSPAARSGLRKLLSAARDGTQIDEIARELEQRGDTVDLVAHFGFITRWQVAGLFDNTAGRGFAAVYPPEHGVDLAATYAGKGDSRVAWRPAVADKAGILDLNRVFADSGRAIPPGAKGPKAVVAYAYAEVESSADRAAEVRAASATAVKVFVNGRPVLVRETYHQSFDRDSFIAPAGLHTGRNAILVKVCQNDQSEAWAQNWMVQLRLTDGLGAAVPLTVVTPGGAR